MPEWEKAPPVDTGSEWQSAPPVNQTNLRIEETMRRHGIDPLGLALSRLPLPGVGLPGVGLGEAATQMATGSAAGVASGLAGLAAPVFGLNPANTVREFQEAFTYQPRTEAGQTVSEAVNAPMAGIERFADWVGEKAAPGAGPIGATAAKTGVLAAPALAGLRRAPTAPLSQRQRVLQQSQERGYVATPSQAGKASVLEGFGGKLKLERSASIRNQQVSNRLAKEALGLAEGTELTPQVLQQVRSFATPVYETLRGMGQLEVLPKHHNAIEVAVRNFRKVAEETPALANKDVLKIADDLKRDSMDSGTVVSGIRLLRDKADAAYRSGETGLGKSYKEMAATLEQVLEDHLSKAPNPALFNEFRRARELIAKSYTVQNALVGGDVSAQVLARQLAKDKPLTGELRQIAEFSSEFPSVSRVIKDSVPMYSPLDAAYQFGSAAAALGTGNPFLAVPAAYSLARPAMRSYLLSEFAQRGLIPPPNALAASPVGIGASGVLVEEDR